jgi:hypothetical protein
LLRNSSVTSSADQGRTPAQPWKRLTSRGLRTAPRHSGRKNGARRPRQGGRGAGAAIALSSTYCTVGSPALHSDGPQGAPTRLVAASADGGIPAGDDRLQIRNRAQAGCLEPAAYPAVACRRRLVLGRFQARLARDLPYRTRSIYGAAARLCCRPRRQTAQPGVDGARMGMFAIRRRLSPASHSRPVPYRRWLGRRAQSSTNAETHEGN